MSAINDLAKKISALRTSEPSKMKKKIGSTSLQTDVNNSGGRSDAEKMPPPSQTRPQAPTGMISKSSESFTTQSRLNSLPTALEPSLVNGLHHAHAVTNPTGKKSAGSGVYKPGSLKQYMPFTEIPPFGNTFYKAQKQPLNFQSYVNIPAARRPYAKAMQWLRDTRADIVRPKRAPFLQQVASFACKWYLWSAEIPDPQRRAEVQASIERNWGRAVLVAVEKGLASGEYVAEEVPTGAEVTRWFEDVRRGGRMEIGATVESTMENSVVIGDEVTNEASVPHPSKPTESLRPPEDSTPMSPISNAASASTTIAAPSRKRKASHETEDVANLPESKRQMLDSSQFGTSVAEKDDDKPGPDHHAHSSNSDFVLPAASPLHWHTRNSAVEEAAEAVRSVPNSLPGIIDGKTSSSTSKPPAENDIAPSSPRAPSLTTSTKPKTKPAASSPVTDAGPGPGPGKEASSPSPAQQQDVYLQKVLLPKVNKLLKAIDHTTPHMRNIRKGDGGERGWVLLKQKLAAAGVPRGRIADLEWEFQHGYEKPPGTEG